VRGNILEKRYAYADSEWRGRFLKLKLMEPGQELVSITTVNGTRSEYRAFDRYEIKRIHVYNSINKFTKSGLVGTVNSLAEYEHTSEVALNGNFSKFWLSEPESTMASHTVDLMDEYLIVGDLEIYWKPKYAARDFLVHYTSYLDPTTW
jgi:hypothetical protein